MASVRMFPLSLCAAVLAVGSACSGRPAELPQARVVYASNDHHAALFVAASLPEYFRNNGDLWLKEVVPRREYLLIDRGHETARVHLTMAPGGDELVRMLSQDQADIALGGFPSMVQAVDLGEPLRVAAPLMIGGTGLVVGKGVEATDWEGFVTAARRAGEPLRIGYRAQGSVQALALERALRIAGIPVARENSDGRAKVVLVDLHGAENLIPALKAGVIEGFTVMQPFLARAEEEGAGRVIAFIEDFDDGQGKGFYPCCAVGMRTSFAQGERRLAASLLTLLLRANRLLAERPAEVVPLVARWLGEKESVEARSLPTIRFVTDFDGQWERGALSWAKAMTAQGKLQGIAAEAARGERLGEVIYDRPLFDAARQAL